MISFDEIYLTKDQILERITEKEIYEYYLSDTIKDKLVKCCFHKDNTPSMGFYKSASGSLQFKCFGCGEQGNVFNFVSRINGDISYNKTLYLIQNTFKLSKNYGNDSRIDITPSISYSGISTRLKTEIIPTYRNFTKIDYDYWNQFYIPLWLLVKYNIKACQLVYILKRSGDYHLFAEYHKNNPMYCYHISDNKKVYRPYSEKKGKWISNTTNYDVQGLAQLPDKGELLIITSSMKDVLVLTIMGYNAISLGGEGNHIPDKILDFLWACFDNLLVFYDNDEAGLMYGKNFSEEIGAGNIFIPLEYNTKDISDFVKEYTLDEGIKLMKESI